jgi:hypothetical protein
MAEEKKGLLGGLLGGSGKKDDDKTDEAKKAEAKAKLDQMAAEKEKREAEEKAAEMEKRAKAAEGKMAMQDAKERIEERHAAAMPKLITEHTLGTDEALSTLALKYYGHATPPYYNYLYETNKDVIGDGGANATRPGMVIKVYELPDELKDK